MRRFSSSHRFFAVLMWFGIAAVLGAAPMLVVAPRHADAIYALGEKVSWTVTLADKSSGTRAFRFTIKKNNAVEVESGELEFVSGQAVVETQPKEPAMLTLQITPPGSGKPVLAAAAIAPTKLAPVVARPADFDSFWAAKLKQLAAVPVEPLVKKGESDREGVAYETVRLNNVGGAHVYGQLARPARAGKFPAVLIMQWASPPYPLQKPWVTERAAEGWLAFNVEPHDVPCDLPADFYAALPQLIKKYESIYNDDRERNYFLRMYLGDYRALDYLTGRPEWDGKTLLVMGTSMGGQQSFAVAGLHPRVTHLIVHVPAGCDSNAPLHDRGASYPNWDSSNPKVMHTALYFDAVNFAPRIKATSLVALGFLDTTAQPVGIWTAFNLIAGPKEVIPLIDAPHNNYATAEQQRPYTIRSAEWLKALASGEPVEVRPRAQ